MNSTQDIVLLSRVVTWRFILSFRREYFFFMSGRSPLSFCTNWSAKFRWEVFWGDNIPGSNFPESKIPWRKCSEVQSSGEQCSEGTIFRGAKFLGAMFRGAKFRGSNVPKFKVPGSKVPAFKVPGAKFRGAKFLEPFRSHGLGDRWMQGSDWRGWV